MVSSLYDLHVTTKTYNARELLDLGARRTLFVDNAYDPSVHRPLDLSPEEREALSAALRQLLSGQILPRANSSSWRDAGIRENVDDEDELCYCATARPRNTPGASRA